MPYRNLFSPPGHANCQDRDCPVCAQAELFGPLRVIELELQNQVPEPDAYQKRPAMSEEARQVTANDLQRNRRRHYNGKKPA